jgi:hypothetical protein
LPEVKPLYERTYSNYYSSDRGIGPMSCFVAGTTVATSIGPRPIESIRIGDFVLAQDCASGELAFKPVVQRTVRPAAPIVSLRTAAVSVSMTRGHPLWVVGRNWQMAKQIALGDRICTTAGPIPITAAHEAKAEETFNLVVADFQTNFVGPQRWLVHDNSPATPTVAKLPGAP